MASHDDLGPAVKTNPSPHCPRFRYPRGEAGIYHLPHALKIIAPPQYWTANTVVLSNMEKRGLALSGEKGSSLDLEKPPSDHDLLPNNGSTSLSSDVEQGSFHAGDEIEEDRRYSLSREPTKTVGKESIITKTLSIVRTKDSGRDPGPPPDGGFEAWLQAGLAHLVIFNTWGFINSFGMFQEYYTQTLQRQPSDISWVGSIQTFLLFAIGTFSGRATDAGFFKPVWGLGAVTIMFAIFMTSLCKTYVQLFLAQGLCLGIGSGLIFCPTMTLLSTYFSSRRSIALAIGACGSATGGIIYPVIVQQLLPRVGFPWTMRVLGLITVVTLAPGFIFFRQRIPPRRSGPFFEWQLSRGPVFLYAVDNVPATRRYSLDTNTIIITFITSMMLFAWIGVKDSPGLYAFSILYGFFGAGLQALFPAVVTSLSTDLKKTGIRFGMILSIVSVASLTGPPIAGALIQKGNGDYLYAQIFAALSMLVGTSVLVMSRYALTGAKIKAKV
ncbi:hypothetical protein CISG_08113 [Coccidioides immitis RMSCC 3703]|uniref:Major facilitator superfamily (MFS) profile domain-containing protein n=1 Tax=Coccidioides immitis RMSCC 3703 TaxID=454286 RepID=A0A0J8R7V3_COCIT|nr:hypothetical protein CISG_08113 [Coccidioides immitis RMSCC 3703]